MPQGRHRLLWVIDDATHNKKLDAGGLHYVDTDQLLLHGLDWTALLRSADIWSSSDAAGRIWCQILTWLKDAA